MYGLPFRRNDYHLGRLLHVENVPASNARRNEYKTFKDVTFKEGFALVVIIAVLFFFWDVSKTNYRLNHTKFGKYFNSY
jgi:hypothetical protein